MSAGRRLLPDFLRIGTAEARPFLALRVEGEGVEEMSVLKLSQHQLLVLKHESSKARQEQDDQTFSAGNAEVTSVTNGRCLAASFDRLS